MTVSADLAIYKSHEHGLELHALCMQADATAFRLLAEQMFAPLLQSTMRYAHYVVRKGMRPYADEDSCDAAVIRALYSYKDNPALYNPELGKSLFRFLVMAAEMDYLNELDKELRRTGSWDALDTVELAGGDSENDPYERQIAADVNVEDVVEQGESQVWVQIRMHLSDARDLSCVYYMMEGVRETSVFVEIYDLHHLPPNEQDHEVKKRKDRIKKKLGRNLDPEEFRNHD